jgi:hypothetical protein
MAQCCHCRNQPRCLPAASRPNHQQGGHSLQHITSLHEIHPLPQDAPPITSPLMAHLLPRASGAKCSATRFRSDGVFAWLSAATAATSPGVCTASSSASEASTGGSRSQQSAQHNNQFRQPVRQQHATSNSSQCIAATRSNLHITTSAQKRG